MSDGGTGSDARRGSTRRSRRDLLSSALVWSGSLALASLWPRGTSAIGDVTRFRIAQLRHGGTWNPRPRAGLALAEEIRYRTSIDVHLEDTSFTVGDDRLFLHPFLLLQGMNELPRFSRSEAARLKTFVELGGLLLVDNVGRTTPSATFDRSFRAEMRRLFPSHKLQRIPDEHVLFRTFYRVDVPVGRLAYQPYLEGIFLDDRAAVIYSRNDLSGAWARNNFGGWRYDVIPGGEPQREMAIRLGVNIVEYALCHDYKDDHVHIDYLLHRRKWRITPPERKPDAP